MSYGNKVVGYYKHIGNVLNLNYKFSVVIILIIIIVVAVVEVVVVPIMDHNTWYKMLYKKNWSLSQRT